jgi:trk system potassium uptake protein TrkH
VNFTIYYYIVNKKIKQALADEELRVYVAIVIVSIAVIAIDISSIYGSVPSGLRYAIFQVTSMVSSTGMVTADFESWPALSRALLFIFMFTGACAGSTSGGAKMVRFIVLYKAAKAELRKIIHPGSEQPIALNGRKVSSDIISKASLFLFCYFFLFIVSVLLVSIEGADILTSSSAVIASLSNSGPGLNAVGAYKNYSKLSALSKSVLSFCMIAGRLEIIPVLILFKPSIWKRGGMD